MLASNNVFILAHWGEKCTILNAGYWLWMQLDMRYSLKHFMEIKHYLKYEVCSNFNCIQYNISKHGNQHYEQNYKHNLNTYIKI